ALEQRVLLYDTYVKYGSATKCRIKLQRKFRYERLPSRQTIYELMDRVLTKGKLDDIGTRLEHTPRKSLNRLTQETGVSKPSSGTATHLLKPSSESWCLVCCKCKKDCCTCVF
ncbi:hypothetical protein B7P43_G03166, partial [Cryptotermes secundus]